MSCVEHSAQKRSVQQFHGEKGGIAVAIELVDPNDVRVRQRLKMLKLALQLAQQLRALGHRRVQHLEGYALTGRQQVETVFIGGFEYRAHAAAAQHSDHSIAAAQHVADCNLWCRE